MQAFWATHQFKALLLTQTTDSPTADASASDAGPSENPHFPNTAPSADAGRPNEDPARNAIAVIARGLADEAEGLEAEALAQVLRRVALERHAASVGPLRGLPAPVGTPLFSLTDETLNSIFKVLPRDIGIEVTIVVEPYRTRFVVSHKDRCWWIDMPGRTNVESGVKIAFTVDAWRMHGLGEVFRSKETPHPFDFRFDPVAETLRISYHKTGHGPSVLTVPATTATPPRLPTEGPPPIRRCPVRPRALRRLLPFLATFIPAIEREDRLRHWRLSGHQFFGHTRRAFCLVELVETAGPDLWVFRGDTKPLRGALYRLDPAKTEFCDYGATLVFTDGVFGHAYPATTGTFSEPENFDALPVMAGFHVAIDDLFGPRMVLDFPPNKSDPRISLRITICEDRVAMIAPAEELPRQLFPGDIQTYAPITRSAAPGGPAAEELTVYVDLQTFLTATSLLRGGIAHFTVLANESGEPKFLQLDCRDDDLRYQVAMYVTRDPAPRNRRPRKP
jgi:hypothetical protein